MPPLLPSPSLDHAGDSPRSPHCPGEEQYYFFNKGTYKVGRKGCDVIVNKDQGVSRIHAEIIIDEMISSDHSMKKPSNIFSKVRVRDYSKYGTFLNKNLDSKEKVHEFPNKETMLKDGDLVSFGTGNATYRFSYVPFIFFICFLKRSKTNQPITKKVSSIAFDSTLFIVVTLSPAARLTLSWFVVAGMTLVVATPKKWLA